MQITLVFEGGIGQNFVALATLKAVKEKYPESIINVIASWPDIFLHNPHVTNVSKLDAPDNFDKYIKNANLFFHKNLYMEMAASQHNQHIVKTFCELHGMAWRDEPLAYSTTPEERDKAKRFYDSFKTNKPKILLQTYSPGSDKNWIPEHVQELINSTCDRYQWIYINDRPELAPYNTFNLINLAIRDLVPLVKYADGLVCVDSCLQHIAGGIYRKPSLMLMGRSKPLLYAWPSTQILSVPSSCEFFGCERPKPMQQDQCLHHRCMYAITPEMVASKIDKMYLKR